MERTVFLLEMFLYQGASIWAVTVECADISLKVILKALHKKGMVFENTFLKRGVENKRRYKMSLFLQFYCSMYKYKWQFLVCCFPSIFKDKRRLIWSRTRIISVNYICGLLRVQIACQFGKSQGWNVKKRNVINSQNLT